MNSGHPPQGSQQTQTWMDGSVLQSQHRGRRQIGPGINYPLATYIPGRGVWRAGKDVLSTHLILQRFRTLVFHLRKETSLGFWDPRPPAGRYLTPYKLVSESGSELQGKPTVTAHAISSLPILSWLSASREIGAINANKPPACPSGYKQISTGVLSPGSVSKAE